MKLLITLFSFICFFQEIAFSQTIFPNLTFRSITSKDGLTSNCVGSFTQSKDGQMWITTTNGLNSYNGNKITNYYHGSGSGIKLNTNGIFTSVIDSLNNLWISDRIGLTKISLNDHSTQYFGNYKDVYKIVNYKKGILFVSSEGIYTIVDTKLTQLNVPFEPYLNNKDYIDHPITAISDRNKNLYLTSIIRIHKISSQNKQSKFYQIPNKVQVTDLFFDNQNNGWVSSWSDGLYKLEQKKDTLFQVLKTENAKAITEAITEWSLGNKEYIIAGYSGYHLDGIIMVDKSTMDYKIFNLSTRVLSTFVDKDGNLWLGTAFKGILIVSHLQGKIESIPILSNKNDQSQSSGSIYTICETKDNFWLTKRYFHGIFKYDKNWKLIKEFGSFKVKNINQYNQIEDGYDYKLVGNLMYCTNDLGMFIIDNITHKRKQIFTPERAEVKLRNLVPINDSTWFIRSLYKGIYVFNPKTNVFKKQYLLDGTIDKLAINYLYKTKKGIIIASTGTGLYIYDTKLDRFIQNKHPILQQLVIFGIAEDRNNILWLCTNKGIKSYNIDKNQIVSNFDSFADMGTAYRVAIDSSDHVWFSCAKGYWSWDLENKRMLKLNVESGLISEFDDSYVHVGKDGSIFLGGVDVVYKINPKSISTHSDAVKIIISGINVNSENRIPTNELGNYRINLAAGLSNLLIEFAVPNYSMEHSFDYAFRFSDSENWSATKDGKIFVPALGHGSHKILMKGVSNFSGIETEIVTLSIIIEPNWYQTWWFKFLAICLLVYVLYLIYRWRLKTENEKSKLKADYEHRLIHLEMQNLRSQMNPHFIFNALNSINGFIVENKTQLASNYLTKFSKLIRMILDHSKNDRITLTKELEALNLYVMMEKNRFDQIFDFEINLENHIDTDQIYVPPLILQPYIENAIWHGLMHQREKGSISIKIIENNDQLCFNIEDNGVGRQKASEFKSKKNVKSNSYGMQITANRIKDHHVTNSITVSDVVDSTGIVKGTRIVIKLKVDE